MMAYCSAFLAWLLIENLPWSTILSAPRWVGKNPPRPQSQRPAPTAPPPPKKRDGGQWITKSMDVTQNGGFLGATRTQVWSGGGLPPMNLDDE